MKSKIALGMFVTVLCAWLVAPIMRIIHTYPPVNLPTEHGAQRVAVVLGAKTRGGVMSNVLRARVDEAIALYQSGQVQHLIFTGGFRDKDPAREPSESHLARAYAMGRGIPNSVIWIEEFSTDTYSNIQQAKHIIEQQKFAEVLLVSDRWHLARAQKMAQDLGLSVVPVPVRHSVFQSYPTKIGFVLREWLKTWAYCLGWRRNL
ncbi:MAG: multidrug transporter [Burkholderiaceae bacterium]|nr:multidrug transporter [Burkholderiaceae bacterium]